MLLDVGIIFIVPATGSIAPVSEMTLDELEQWLSTVESVLRSQSNPSSLIHCEAMLTELKVTWFNFPSSTYYNPLLMNIVLLLITNL